jgi:predicted PurR-regulated permease PerM
VTLFIVALVWGMSQYLTKDQITLVSKVVSNVVLFGVIIAFIVLRQIEDQFVMPIVVGRAVHLHPLVPIFSVLTGGAIAGILGAILGVPIAAAVRVTLDALVPSTPAQQPDPFPEARRA